MHRLPVWACVVGSLLGGLGLPRTHVRAEETMVHWTFDTSEGVLRDAAGEAHGVFEGLTWPDRVRPGPFGKAVHFEAGKSRVRIPHQPAVSLGSAFAIAYVIKPFRTDGFRTILWKGDRTVTPEAINYYVDLRDGRPELKTKDADGRWTVYSAATALEPDQWHHVVITYRAGTVGILINGEPDAVRVSEDGARGEALLENGYDACVGDGASPHGSAYSFDGLIDDIRIVHGRDAGGLASSDGEAWRTSLAAVREREAAFAVEQQRRRDGERLALERDFDDWFAARSAGTGTRFIAAVLDSARRLDGAPDFFRRLPGFSRDATLAAARREYEGFQVVLVGRRHAGATPVSFSVSDLVRSDGAARLPSTAVSVGRIERVTTEPPDIPVAFVGPIPDVIVEDGAPTVVPPADFAVLYCRITTGDALPGIYTGTLTLSGDGQHETIRMALTVYDFALPTRPSLRTAFCFFESYYQQWYGWTELDDVRREQVYEFLLDYRLSPCNIYSRGAPFPELRFLEKYRDRITFFTVGKVRGDTSGNARADAAELLPLLRRLREAGLDAFMYYYGVDELSLHLEHLPAATRSADALREVWPDLKMMQTSPPIPQLQPLHDVWVPVFHHFSPPERSQEIEAMRQRGDEIWWYAADAPHHPYPNFFLDYPVFDCRVIGMLSYVHNVTGVLYWCINREWQTNMDSRGQWPGAPWKAHIYSAITGKRKFKNGMGNLVYPGKDGRLLPSLRLENLRDGLEDHDYLDALRRAVVEMEAGGRPELLDLLPEARALLQPPPEVMSGVGDWSHDPAGLMAYRNQVGRMLERIAQAERRR